MMEKIKRSYLRLITLIGLLVVIPVIATCGGTTEPTKTIQLEDNLTISVPTPGPFEIFITENGFIPAELTIVSGNKVTWINEDDAWRAVAEAIPTGESIAEQPYGVSGRLQPGETYAQTFSLPSVWQYWCPKTGQSGIIIIE